MPENKHLRFLLIALYIVLGCFFVVKILPHLIVVFLPFILATFVALITRPIVKLLRKCKFPNLPASLLALALVLAAVTGVVVAIVYRLVVEITMLSGQLPALISALPDTIEGFIDRWNAITAALSPSMSGYINDALNSLASSLLSLVTPATHKILNIATDVAASLPYILIFTVTFLFSCIFFTKDFDYLKTNLSRQFPEPLLARLAQVKGYAFSAFGKYLRGVVIILCVTFAELLTGFLILDIPYAFLLALLIALMDALPAVGTGLVLIPWSAVEFLSGDYRTGISIFVIYLIILVVRQFVEPKIMSSSFGTYPVLTLIGMYAGLKLFGVSGLVLLPITLTVVV
ncbi:MAG: sporulation integral membrane protein YtvI, partial [Clostridiales bacterium]|nr:sporulation integral membrane protein YtvI [Clostridiales bacterium]